MNSDLAIDVQGMTKRAEQHDALQVILREIARRMSPEDTPGTTAQPSRKPHPKTTPPAGKNP